MLAIQSIVLAFAAFAAAVPHGPPKGGNTNNVNTEVDSDVKFTSVKEAHDQCSHMNDGKNQISCCNDESEQEAGGLLGVNLGSLLGGNCQPIAIPILGIDVPITDYCNQQVACCSGDQNVSVHLIHGSSDFSY